MQLFFFSHQRWRCAAGFYPSLRSWCTTYTTRGWKFEGQIRRNCVTMPLRLLLLFMVGTSRATVFSANGESFTKLTWHLWKLDSKDLLHLWIKAIRKPSINTNHKFARGIPTFRETSSQFKTVPRWLHKRLVGLLAQKTQRIIHLNITRLWLGNSVSSKRATAQTCQALQCRVRHFLPWPLGAVQWHCDKVNAYFFVTIKKPTDWADLHKDKVKASVSLTWAALHQQDAELHLAVSMCIHLANTNIFLHVVYPAKHLRMFQLSEARHNLLICANIVALLTFCLWHDSTSM